MGKRIGLLSTGVNDDTYFYVEATGGESLAIGTEEGSTTFNINISDSPNAVPTASTANFSIEATVNGNLSLQPNGSGVSKFVSGDVDVVLGDFDIQGGNLLLASTSGTDGQVVLGSSTGNAAWGSLTSIDGSVTFTPGANSLDLSVSGSAAADTFQTDVGTATPTLGVLDVLGGSNINTSGAGNVVTTNLDNDISINTIQLFEAAGGDDPFTRYTITGLQNYSMGIDNSDTDNLKITTGADPSSGTTIMLMANSGSVVLPTGPFRVSNNDVFIDNGDLDMSNTTSGNILLAASNSSSTRGMVFSNSLRAIHFFGDRNSWLGQESGNPSLTTATDCTGIGYLSQNAMESGQKNTSLGANSLQEAQSGNNNTAIGYRTLQDLDGASVCTALGSQALKELTSGDSNTATGFFSQGTQQTGSNNASYGRQSLSFAQAGDQNTAIGDNSLLNLDDPGASNNTALGFDSGRSLTTSVNNTCIGYDSLNGPTTGSYNSCLGYSAGSSLATSDSNNILIRNVGTGGDNNTIRIGTQGTGNGQQDTTFIAGIQGVTPAGGNDGMVIVDTNGQLGSQDNLVMPSNPAFLAFVNPAVADVTGDGTLYTIVFDNERFDQGGDFDTTTGVFTAPVTGKYQFNVAVYLNDITGSHNTGDIRLVTSNATYITSFQNVGAAAIAVNGGLGVTMSVTCDMDVNDTADVRVLVDGSAKVVDIESLGTTNLTTYFSGSLVS